MDDPEIYEGMPPPPKTGDMTREDQTMWIVGAILLVGLMILYFMTRLPTSHPDKECETLFGMDSKCQYEHATRRLNRGIVY